MTPGGEPRWKWKLAVTIPQSEREGNGRDAYEKHLQGKDVLGLFSWLVDVFADAERLVVRLLSAAESDVWCEKPRRLAHGRVPVRPNPPKTEKPWACCRASTRTKLPYLQPSLDLEKPDLDATGITGLSDSGGDVDGGAPWCRRWAESRAALIPA
jgi:hypothetical protein